MPRSSSGWVALRFRILWSIIFAAVPDKHVETCRPHQPSYLPENAWASVSASICEAAAQAVPPTLAISGDQKQLLREKAERRIRTRGVRRFEPRREMGKRERGATSFWRYDLGMLEVHDLGEEGVLGVATALPLQSVCHTNTRIICYHAP